MDGKIPVQAYLYVSPKQDFLKKKIVSRKAMWLFLLLVPSILQLWDQGMNSFSTILCCRLVIKYLYELRGKITAAMCIRLFLEIQ